MALINRMSRLFAADVHAVLDRIEEPEALLRQAIREMEDAVARGERALEALRRERDGLAARRRKAAASAAELDAQLDVCFAAGNDDLARKLVRRKLEADRLAGHLDERGAALEAALADRTAALAEQRERLEVMRQKAELYAEAAEVGAAERAPGDFAVGEDEVEVALLRERQRRVKA